MLNTFDQLKDLIVKHLGFETADEITLTAVFTDDLNADSLDRIELMMACEEAFGIAIADLEAEAVRNVGDLVALVDRKVAAKGVRA